MCSKFTLEEEKALHLIFSYIKPFNFKNSTTIKIEKKYFFEKLNLIGDDKYKRYKILISKLRKQTETEIIGNDWNYEGFMIIGSNWFYKQPFFEVDLNPKFMPYIEQLKEHYTKVDLKFNKIPSFETVMLCLI